MIQVGDLPAADRDQECVVAQLLALDGLHDAAGGIDRRDGIPDPLGTRVAGDVPELVAANPTEPDGLAHGEGPIRELVVRRHERELHEVARKASQPKQPLDGADAATADHHLKAVHHRPG